MLALAMADDGGVPNVADDFQMDGGGRGAPIRSKPRDYDDPYVLNPNERFTGSERLNIYIEFEFVPVPDGPLSGETVGETTCLNACQGPPPDHATHRACDRLCDRPCDRKHDMVLTYGALEQEQEGINTLGRTVREMVAASNNRGMPVVMDDFAVLDAIGVPFDYVRNKLKPVEIKQPGHLWQEGSYPPCHQTVLTYKSLQFDVRASVFVEYEQFSGPADRPTGSSFQTFARRGPFVIGRFRGIDPSPRGVGSDICLCEKPTTVGQIDEPFIKLGDGYAVFPTDLYGDVGGALDWFDKHGLDLQVRGENLSYATLDLAADQQVEISLPPGTFLFSQDAMTQPGMVVGSIRTTFSFMAGLNPSFAPQRFRFACLDMKKKQPTTATRFVPMPAADPVLVLLARQTAGSRFQGPWDQVRIWIYTNEAKYDEIGRILLPNVSRGTYLQCLREVAEFSARRRGGQPWGSLIEPSVLLDANGDERALAWGAASLTAEQLKATLAYARSAALPSDFDEDWATTCSSLIAAFSVRKEADAHALARVLAERWVPAGARSSVAASGGFDGLIWMATARGTEHGRWAREFLRTHAPAASEVAEGILSDSVVR
jgi:hypothetical protein